jgi:hypothetical protein
MQLFDEIYSTAFELMISEGKLADEGQEIFLSVMDGFYKMLDEEFDESTQKGIDKKTEFMCTIQNKNSKVCKFAISLYSEPCKFLK